MSQPASTVALNMIVKDELEQVLRIVEKAQPYVDQINLTVSDQATATALKKVSDDKLRVEYREWTDKFDEARNANWKMATTTYGFWLDADDVFAFQTIPKIVQVADQGYDAIFLPYNYAHDEDGNVITRHWRERLIRLSHPFTWKGWVHESLISDVEYSSTKIDQPVIHTSTHVQESTDRNHAILEKAVAETGDPRYIHYLGLSYFTRKEYRKALEVFSEYLTVGGWDEEIYRTLCTMSEASYHLRHHESALSYASQAAVMLPHYPMAYWLLAQYEADQGNHEQALEWLKVSESKPDPDSMSIFDPTSRIRAALIGANSCFAMGRMNEALAWLRKVPKEDATRQSLEQDLIDEADAETFINLLPRFRKFFATNHALYDALCYDVKYDKRIKQLRYSVTKPKVWGDKSIVYFCGEGYEEWGPHTLDKGMGGSEEAVIYLSREMAKLGYEVTVYNAVNKPEYDFISDEQPEPKVTYLPWKEFDPRDQFNIFIGWRAPEFCDKVHAKVKLADIHDLVPEDFIKPRDGVTYMFKSQFHKDKYGEVDSRVIGNGIAKEQFKEEK